MKREIKTLKHKVKTRNKKIESIEQVIDELKKNLLIKSEEASLLHNSFDGFAIVNV
eukprot:gene2844-3289_t